jgi:DNA-binding HxlR family transcriptional regulator
LTPHPIDKETAKCFVEQTVAVIGDKWSLLILGELAFGESPFRFNELLRRLKPISSKTLSVKLIKLQKNGIVQKVIEAASPPYTHYSLTEKGEDLMAALKAMADWSVKWQKQSASKELKSSRVD